MFGKKIALYLFVLLVAGSSGGGARAQEARGGDGSGAQVFVRGGDNHLGVSVESVTRENMSGLNLSGEPRGVVVRDVATDSAAAKAGLQKNDVILRFDGEQVSSVRKLQRLIDESAPEHTARLSISRAGAEQELSVKLARRAGFAPEAFRSFTFPEGFARGFNTDELKRRAEELKHNSEEWKKHAKEWEQKSREMGRGLEKFRAEGFGDNFTLVYGAGSRRIGIATQTLTDQLANYFGVSGRDGGLLITSVTENSPASKAGLRAGDVVTEVDGTRLKNAGELARALNRKEEGEVSLTIVRDRKTRTIKVTPDRTQNNPTFFTPGSVGGAAPMALIAPRVHVTPRVQIAPRTLAPVMPSMPRITPLVAPRLSAPAPRIYNVPSAAPIAPIAPIAPVAPVAPARSGVWVL